jgi:hypothetical protein
MKNILAFLNGVREFRSSFTMWYADNERQHAYDMGREWAHRLTMRRYDYA